MLGGSGVSGEDAGAAAGLFLTTAQSSIALSCNLVLQAVTFLLVLLLRRVGRSTRQQRISTRVAPTEPSMEGSQ